MVYAVLYESSQTVPPPLGLPGDVLEDRPADDEVVAVGGTRTADLQQYQPVSVLIIVLIVG